MKKLLLTTAAIAALAAGSANAADMRVKAAPLPPPPPPCAQFGGLYVGAHAGWVYARRETTDVDFLWNGATTVSTGSGFAGGIQGGYNWQFRCTVWGFEADASWASDRDRDFSVHFPNFDFLLHRELKSFGTLRTRTGLIVDNVMLYVTGGLAWARVNSSVSFDRLNDAFPAFTASNDATRWGWTVGFGSEWAWGGGWSIKSEALYMSLSTGTSTYQYPLARRTHVTVGSPPTPRRGVFALVSTTTSAAVYSAKHRQCVPPTDLN